MGSIFSRNRKKSTVEILQELDKEIDELETNQADKEYNRRRSIGYLILISLFLFIGAFIYSYLYLFSRSDLGWERYVIGAGLISIFPVVVLLIIWAIRWWYEQSLSMNERKLVRLRRRKREILDCVKDTETYKVAKEILERFDPQVKQERQAKKAREFQQQMAAMRRYGSLDGDALVNTGSQIRNRKPKSRPSSPKGPDNGERESLSNPNTRRTPTPAFHPSPPSPSVMPSVSVIPPTPSHSTIATAMINTGPIVRMPGLNNGTSVGPLMTPTRPFVSIATGRPASGPIIPVPIRMPRPILPRERSAFDKVMDFLLGDGPSNRYALICHECHSHNGMALKEEIETMAFRCCYCFAFNPAKKLPQPLQPLSTTGNGSENSSDQNYDLPKREIDQESPLQQQAHPNQGFHNSRPSSRGSLISLDSSKSAPPFCVIASENCTTSVNDSVGTVAMKGKLDENGEHDSLEVQRQLEEVEDSDRSNVALTSTIDDLDLHEFDLSDLDKQDTEKINRHTPDFFEEIHDE